MADWCILRCAASRTLALAESLTEAGFEVWTPVEVVRKRARRTAEREDVRVPIMPSFLFARAGSLDELAALSRSPTLNYLQWDRERRRMVTKGHSAFSVFRQHGRYPLVRDHMLAPLRIVEKRSRPRAAIRSFKPGECVRMIEGGFAGLTGTVEATQGQYTLVSFPGFPIAVKFATWLLLDGESSITVKNAEQAQVAEAA